MKCSISVCSARFSCFQPHPFGRQVLCWCERWRYSVCVCVGVVWNKIRYNKRHSSLWRVQEGERVWAGPPPPPCSLISLPQRYGHPSAFPSLLFCYSKSSLLPLFSNSFKITMQCIALHLYLLFTTKRY